MHVVVAVDLPQRLLDRATHGAVDRIPSFRAIQREDRDLTVTLDEEWGVDRRFDRIRRVGRSFDF
ncbi:hypothetical protein GS4_34_00220 [Gordonia soli NBRC 108243]|uniref:Uncharacterized protein n=1 Tax=Gordonia soli NBRC 108243 TaxID=1223545 RepID=M0QRT0_9ACTN|nr:hypothetical protein GS4_34_00220 [Gordonia soli NBRC 108243]